MRILYFDCFSGISGDMAVGGLLDLGVPEDYLTASLAKLEVPDEYSINIKKNMKNGIQGTDFCVDLIKGYHNEGEHNNHHGRNLFDIEALIDSSTLNENIKVTAKKIFKIIGEAEARVHGKSLYETHFHEVGEIDSILDIVGIAICMDYLKPDRVLSSFINTGSGYIKCSHGILPVPAPATAVILKNVPVFCDERKFELTTPTGAAIVKALAEEFTKPPEMRMSRVGYGCGKRDTGGADVLRVILYDSDNELANNFILETNIISINCHINTSCK